jgi:hypothetical protein
MWGAVGRPSQEGTRVNPGRHPTDFAYRSPSREPLRLPSTNQQRRGFSSVSARVADFCVTQIDPRTLSLGSLPLRIKNTGQPQYTLEDVNGDGYSDLVCQFADNGTLGGRARWP